ncbi:MAG: hypothetical protein QM766_10130 [Burkholderiaceae bacterium]
MIQGAAYLSTVIGLALIYLASGHQSWLPRRLPPGPSRVAGAGLLVAALACWSSVLHPVAAVFVLVTSAMLALIAYPALGALRVVCRRGR